MKEMRTGLVEHAVVLGAGSAGLLAAIALKTLVPSLSVRLVYSSEIGVIGVGEGTTVAVPRFLHGDLAIDPGLFYRDAQPTPKLGIRFLWGPRRFYDYTFSSRQMDWKYAVLSKPNGFYCADEMECIDVPSSLMSYNKGFRCKPNGDPFIGQDLAYHIENERFVALLLKIALDRGVRLIDATVERAVSGDFGITKLQTNTGEFVDADLFVDCSGFQSRLLGSELHTPFVSFKNTLFCDRAVIATWDRTDEPIQPYTTAETMDAGWCWRIDHLDSIARGYVYSSSFVSDEMARDEFVRKNPDVKTTRVVKFISGRYERTWSKNVVAIGNASGFVEPLEATSLATICDEARMLCVLLNECNCRPTESTRTALNTLTGNAWDQIRQFLGIHYKFNRRLDTPFWKACRADVDIRGARAIVDYYSDHGPATSMRYAVLSPLDMFGMDGYLAHLVGQQVPTSSSLNVAPDEQHTWQGFIEENRRIAIYESLDVREAYQRILGPHWQWDPSFYRRGSHLHATVPSFLSSAN